MGLQDKRVADQSMTASSYQSTTYAPYRARLHLPYGWTPKRNRAGEWFEVDFTAKARVSRVGTQGRSNTHYWVKSYYVTYSKDRSTYITYKENRRRKVRSNVLYARSEHDQMFLERLINVVKCLYLLHYLNAVEFE